MASFRRAPAITPDARHQCELTAMGTTRTVSFTALKTPTVAATTLTTAASSANNGAGDSLEASSRKEANHIEATLRHYSLYRSAPDQFPSYERLRFVRLPRDWIPARLRKDFKTRNGSAGAGAAQELQKLQYWPALVYQNLAELVRDLSPAESRLLKAKMILEHRKRPTTVVARLLGWNHGGVGGSNSGDTGGVSSNSGSAKRTSDDPSAPPNPFEEPKLELLRLSGLTLEENEDRHGDLISFVDGQLELESVCDEILARYNGKTSKSKKKTENIEVVRFALQFRRAVDMALNCLALDMGDNPLPVRNEDGAAVVLATPSNGSAVTHLERPKSVLKTPSENLATAKKDDSRKKVTIGGDKEEAAAKKQKKKEKKSEKSRSKKNSTESKKARVSSEKENSVPNNKNRKEPKVNVSKGGTAKSQKHEAKSQAVNVSKSKKDEAVEQPAAKEEPSKSDSNVPKSESNTSNDNISSTASISSSESTEANDVPWKDVWNHMKKSGWTWKGGTGLMTDYYYIKPGKSVKDGKTGQDYFISAEDTQEHVRRTHGWGELPRDDLFAAIEEHSKYSGETVPSLKESIDPSEPWREAWEKMLQSGWTWRPGSGLMLDYYYVKPGCHVRGGKEGQDYFVAREDVKKFARRNYGWRGSDGEGDRVSGRADKKDSKAEKRRSSGSRSSGEHPNEKRQRVERAKPQFKKVAAEKVEPEEPIDSRDDVEDDSNESLSDTRSTYSESGFQSKKLFLEECADENVPPLTQSNGIDPDEPWKDVWKKMCKDGWTWKQGTGLMMDYYYIKPGCMVKGGVEGRDYFVSVEGAQQFAMRNYGWRGGKGNASHNAINSLGGRKRRVQSDNEDLAQNKRQQVEKAKEQLPEDESSSSTASPYDKKALWQALQKEGWKAISAGKYNMLHDWYYVAPGCNPGDGKSKLGVDYFLSEEEAIESVHRSAMSSMAVENPVQSKTIRQSLKDLNPTNSKRNVPAAKGLETPADCRTKPQDPAIPLLPSPVESCTSTSEDQYQWHNLWPILQRAGWTSIKAAKYSKLHDWYYVRPKRDPGDKSTKLGRHYFASQNDVIEYVRKFDMEGAVCKSSRKSMSSIMETFEEEATLCSSY